MVLVLLISCVITSVSYGSDIDQKVKSDYCYCNSVEVGVNQAEITVESEFINVGNTVMVDIGETLLIYDHYTKSLGIHVDYHKYNIDESNHLLIKNVRHRQVLHNDNIRSTANKKNIKPHVTMLC